ncbi:hypothetical protein AUK04_00935 [Candidatus Roizmanbacteria bacterium CG2_30_33_16]|uniref:HIT domain-containing protein n=3 Tax=Candidatus Roizmaniibacteriota TaxID=1752723 RepID=A0A2M7BW98_9BACT|nr:hypothetical protein [Candidatus Roizmanbacteria bacterium]OIP85863.1 MAG: hypothetical protein AUK04_00935 [Candidatus Roizmanbacteria bacterium CG2_30_33_16]PIP63160.1 MAG: hypothetical protein COW98_00110 [Candidatus Roizmanbacteria bacterium CG22_combo_CG10-13_8_21_14_all_35_9]PIV10866.1 MAG: hypothetical protein COS50_03210 [Candidatus Roizmanbacteria bacterium CG03_land_8_20_14_0_80_35_26]
MNKQKCLFCKKLKGHAKNIAILVPEYREKKLLFYETNHFYLTAELHPVVKDPYFLIVPKKHYKAFSQINISYAKEMDEIIQYLRGLFIKTSYVIFEHGEVYEKNKIQSVHHAHSHVILTNTNYLSYIEAKMQEYKMKTSLIKFTDNSTLREVQKKIKDKSYLLFRQGFNS